MRSPQNTATASESLYVPVGAAAATTEPAPTRALRVRVVGAAAIASAASVVIDNTVVGWAGSPTYAAPIKDVLAFHAENRAAVAIAVGLEALTLPLLLLFVTGLHGLVGRRGGAGADWSDNVPVNIVQRLMGHENASTTLNRYVHAPRDYDDRVRGLLDDAC